MISDTALAAYTTPELAQSSKHASLWRKRKLPICGVFGRPRPSHWFNSLYRIGYPGPWDPPGAPVITPGWTRFCTFVSRTPNVAS